MDAVSPDKSRESLTVRRQRATRARIATAAVQRVSENGLAGVTVEQIAAAAEVGRATFFRYFSSKEDAVAEGADYALAGCDHRGHRQATGPVVGG